MTLVGTAGYGQIDKLAATFGPDVNYVFDVDPVAAQLIDGKALKPGIEIIGVQTVRFPAMFNAIKGTHLPQGNSTIAEGIAVGTPGLLPQAIIRNKVNDLVLVDEGDIEQAVLMLLEIEKTLVEGAGAAGLAALLKEPGRYKGKRVGLVLCGGNIDPLLLAAILERGMVRAGRLARIRVAARDTPGVLARITTIVGEAGAIGSATDPTFDKVTMLAWKYATPIVKLSVELLQDSAVNLEELLGELFGDRMGRGQAAHFMTGDGTTQPEGMATNATVAVNLATGNAITIDKVLELIHALDIAYREGAIFIMNDATALALRKLKDSDGQYLWQPSVQAGQADTLLGYPVFIHNSLTSIATPGDNQKLIVFGNPKHYLVRDVASSMQVTRLDELYAASGQVGFVMLMRTDGRVIGHSGSFVTLNSYDAP